MNSSDLTDAHLLQLVQQGDEGAFDLFVNRYGRRILGFGLRMCRHHHDAEDVFQETLLTAYRGLSSIREPRAVKTWLFRTAANHCLMRRRKDSSERKAGQSEPAQDSAPESEDEMEALTELPDDAAERAELRRFLESALARLEPEYRMVVILRDVEGLSTRETSEVMEIGESAVKMRLHRARMVLRDALSQYATTVRKVG